MKRPYPRGENEEITLFYFICLSSPIPCKSFYSVLIMSLPPKTCIDPSQLTTDDNRSEFNGTCLEPATHPQFAYPEYSLGLWSLPASVVAYPYSGAEATPHSPGRRVPSQPEIVRQARRDPQPSRRSNKLHSRSRAFSEARSSVAPDMSQNINSVAASTTASSYVPSSYDSHNNRTPSLPSTIIYWLAQLLESWSLCLWYKDGRAD